MFRLLDLPWPKDDQDHVAAAVLRVSKEAHTAWKAFAESIEVDLADGGRFECVRDWAGKLYGLAARLAGNLHAMEHLEKAAGLEISGDTMRRAVQLASALSEHALAAFGMMGADPEQEAAKIAQTWIHREGVERFSLRDCHRGIRGKYPKADKVQAALAILAERDFIALGDSAPPSGPGRKPSPTYTVNPRCFSA